VFKLKYSGIMWGKRKKLRVIFQSMLFIGLLLVVLAGVGQMGIVREFFGQASFIPANLFVNTKAVLGPLPRPWRNLAQGGESHAWRIAPIADSVRALHPEYIRLDHIYDFYDIVSGSPGNFTVDFSKLDLVLNDIKSVGAAPYISLSYMPPALGNGDITGAPVNYSDWQSLVQQTIQHISGTLNFRDVYYEVWNEPDLFGGWKYYGNKSYLDLYAASARGAAATRNTQAFKIGGPATTALYKNWIDALLTFTSKNNLRIDFISWHKYTYDLDQYRVDLAQARTWVSAYPQYNGQMEYQITEWGHNSELDGGYDGRLGAAHTVASAITMVGALERGFVFEIQDGLDPSGKPYWGRWGLITANEHGAKPKPRYWALRMLDSLASQRLQLLGQGSKVKALSAKTEDGKVQTILANFDPKGIGQETVPITYQYISPGNYELSMKYLSGDVRVDKIATTTATLRMLVPVPSNDVVFTELVKK
jgi:hypothetical protein